MFDHLSLVTAQLEVMKDFYIKYFGGEAVKWISPDGAAHIYFIRWPNGAKLELEMDGDHPRDIPGEKGSRIGFSHLAFQVETREEVDRLTKRMEEDGVPVYQQPWDYGTKEFYESTVLDPDGNYVEIVVDPGFFD